MPKSESNHITTLIGDGCEFEGNMSTSTSTRIDGKLNGRIAGQNTIVVGENGVVMGEVRASETVVFGRVEGVIESGSLEIKRSGIVLGDVFIEPFAARVSTGTKDTGKAENERDIPLFNGAVPFHNPAQSAIVQQVGIHSLVQSNGIRNGLKHMDGRQMAERFRCCRRRGWEQQDLWGCT